MDSDAFSRQQLNDLLDMMIEYNEGDAKQIQHLMKVHGFARQIGKKEELDEISLFILEAAAYMHDIGIRVAEEKYGRCDERLQEQEGPIVAQQMLSELGFENYIIERICYLIGHHHTYTNVDGQDYQILIEANALVNLFDDDAGNYTRKKTYNKIFKTKYGRELFCTMFGCNWVESEEE